MLSVLNLNNGQHFCFRKSRISLFWKLSIFPLFQRFNELIFYLESIFCAEENIPDEEYNYMADQTLKYFRSYYINLTKGVYFLKKSMYVSSILMWRIFRGLFSEFNKNVFWCPIFNLFISKIIKNQKLI